MIDLIHLATEAEDDGGADVGVIHYAAECALELIGIGANGVAATFTMRERRYTVDAGREFEAGEVIGDHFGGVGGAVGRGYHCDIVTGANATVFTLVAQEGGDIGGKGGERLYGCGKFVVESLFFECEVLGVDVFAWFNGMFGAADDLTIADDVFAGGD